MSKQASGTEGGVCIKLPTVGYTDTLRTNKAFKKKLFYFHIGVMKATQYANILT